MPDARESFIEIHGSPKPVVDLALKLLAEQIQTCLGQLLIHLGDVDIRVYCACDKGGIVFFINSGNLFKHIQRFRLSPSRVFMINQFPWV